MKLFIFLMLMTLNAHAVYSLNSNNISLCPQSTLQDYKIAVSKLINVNAWKSFYLIKDQSFDLFNSRGQKLNRTARTGDFIRIKLPLDPTRGSYWVKIESIKSSVRDFTMTVRPSLSPKLPYEDDVTDHFFTNRALNRFSVSLSGTLLKASVRGTNEEANTTQVRNIIDAQTNLVIATMSWGYYAGGESKYGFQNMIWKIFTEKIAKCD